MIPWISFKLQVVYLQSVSSRRVFKTKKNIAPMEIQTQLYYNMYLPFLPSLKSLIISPKSYDRNGVIIQTTPFSPVCLFLHRQFVCWRLKAWWESRSFLFAWRKSFQTTKNPLASDHKTTWKIQAKLLQLEEKKKYRLKKTRYAALFPAHLGSWL